MPKHEIHPLVFTDLDGTLLDHHTYSAAPAAEFVEKLLSSSLATVIPVTSKTEAELVALDDKLPFGDSIKISENGSVVTAPETVVGEFNVPPKKILGVKYSDILKALTVLPQVLRDNIRGFADMDVPEIVQHTGLSLCEARLAKDRQATEPFLWSGTSDQLDELRVFMKRAGIQIVQGGRFYHLTGGASKWQAIQWVVAAMCEVYPDRNFKVITLGDGPNDLEMIENADYGVIIPNISGAAIHSDKSHVRVGAYSGPEGWVAAVKDILNEMGIF